MNEFKALLKEKWVNVQVSLPIFQVSQLRLLTDFAQLHNDDIFNWDVALIVINPDSMYYGGYFKASMTFPPNYPYAPPSKHFLHSF